MTLYSVLAKHFARRIAEAQAREAAALEAYNKAMLAERDSGAANE
jgi:hypothetical protein